jgi:hypothetical protein
VAVPFRRGQRWAWWAAWIVMIADLGYTFTFGIRDHVILARSLAVDVALAVPTPGTCRATGCEN